METSVQVLGLMVESLVSLGDLGSGCRGGEFRFALEGWGFRGVGLGTPIFSWELPVCVNLGRVIHLVVRPFCIRFVFQSLLEAGFCWITERLLETQACQQDCC